MNSVYAVARRTDIAKNAWMVWNTPVNTDDLCIYLTDKSEGVLTMYLAKAANGRLFAGSSNTSCEFTETFRGPCCYSFSRYLLLGSYGTTEISGNVVLRLKSYNGI